jgi:LytS/YehU family sensor histidine kinase
MKISMMPPMSKNFTFILILVLLVVGAVSSITILDQNFKTISRNKELQNKILAAQLELKEQELHYLKSQIHPHFLFNTLNTIYGMAIKQSKQTPELILRLSNLLDYILYQISKPRVALKEEVLHIEEYVELERIRFKDTLNVNLSYGDIGDKIGIAPMLLIPFVENAFKHGSIIDGYLKININVKAERDKLYFFISNTTLNYGNNREPGIGLDNTIKRLDLHYAGNYELNRELTENIFKVELIINNLGKISDA